MQSRRIGAVSLLTLFTLAPLVGSAQVSVPLPGRSLNKLLPDYLHPRVFALNRADGSLPGTVLAGTDSVKSRHLPYLVFAWP